MLGWAHVIHHFSLHLNLCILRPNSGVAQATTIPVTLTTAEDKRLHRKRLAAEVALVLIGLRAMAGESMVSSTLEQDALYVASCPLCLGRLHCRFSLIQALATSVPVAHRAAVNNTSDINRLLTDVAYPPLLSLLALLELMAFRTTKRSHSQKSLLLELILFLTDLSLRQEAFQPKKFQGQASLSQVDHFLGAPLLQMDRLKPFAQVLLRASPICRPWLRRIVAHFRITFGGGVDILIFCGHLRLVSSLKQHFYFLLKLFLRDFSFFFSSLESEKSRC
mmetsp:Transcript_7766/g.17749  ORF Transcript_7766/g.17749 Transcript_7766/m.17749 type:complete len:278 (+) Transcript_7766:937-1770(+)